MFSPTPVQSRGAALAIPQVLIAVGKVSCAAIGAIGAIKAEGPLNAARRSCRHRLAAPRKHLCDNSNSPMQAQARPPAAPAVGQPAALRPGAIAGRAGLKTGRNQVGETQESQN